MLFLQTFDIGLQSADCTCQGRKLSQHHVHARWHLHWHGRRRPLDGGEVLFWRGSIFAFYPGLSSSDDLWAIWPGNFFTLDELDRAFFPCHTFPGGIVQDTIVGLLHVDEDNS